MNVQKITKKDFCVWVLSEKSYKLESYKVIKLNVECRMKNEELESCINFYVESKLQSKLLCRALND